MRTVKLFLNTAIAIVFLTCAARASTIDPEVRDELQSHGSVQVIIALQDAVDMIHGGAAEHSPGCPVEVSQKRIHQAQNSVLSCLNPGGFDIAYSYTATLALAGTINTLAALDRLQACPEVGKVLIDQILEFSLHNSVPMINADDRHPPEGNGGSGVTVAVIDSGINTANRLFASAAEIKELCFSSTGSCPDGANFQAGPGAAQDNDGHGTHVAGIIISNGVIGGPDPLPSFSLVGVAPRASIVAMKANFRSESGGMRTREAMAAMDYIRSHPDLGVRVINISLRTPTGFL